MIESTALLLSSAHAAPVAGLPACHGRRDPASNQIFLMKTRRTAFSAVCHLIRIDPDAAARATSDACPMGAGALHHSGPRNRAEAVRVAEPLIARDSERLGRRGGQLPARPHDGVVWQPAQARAACMRLYFSPSARPACQWGYLGIADCRSKAGHS
jgi:hypothetical protein